MTPYSRTTPRLLAAAVAVALAATVSGPTAQALAVDTAPRAVTARAAAGEQAAPLDLPDDAKLLSAGRTGMLTSTGWQQETAVHRWTPYAGGATVTLPAGPKWGSTGSDLVASKDGDVYTLTDMSGTAEPVVIDTSGLGTPGERYHLRRVIGTTLVMSHYLQGESRWTFHLVSVENGRTVDRPIASPVGQEDYDLYDAGPGRIVIGYGRLESTHYVQRLCVVDVATGEVTETYEAFPDSSFRIGSVAQSPNHLAWIEWRQSPVLAFAPRGTQDVERIPLTTTGEASDVEVRPLGDWALYTRPGGGTAYTGADPLHALTARSLTTGEAFEVLDHASSTAYDRDGNLLVLGGTLAQGEGLYRIAPDAATGRPAATLVRGSGRPTALVVQAETLPPTGTVDFDRAGGQLTAAMTLSRPNANVTLKLTHTASGRTAEPHTFWPGGMTHPTATWNGWFDDGYPAYNGAYTWTMTATPANGIGPATVRSGSFTLTRAPRPHDFDGNGSPDVFVRENSMLSLYDAGQITRLGSFESAFETRIGFGWNTYDRITATGDIGGTRNGDLVARDRTGALWLFEGRGDAKTPFRARFRVGGGWQVYDRLAGGSDLTGDGRNDLIASDRTGVLWLHPGTGSATKPFAARKRVGAGWGVYNQLTATGNLAGGPAGDVVARDKAGVLWLHLGKGDGTFAPRTRIGGGWGALKSVVGLGDVDGDGRNDLMALKEVVGEYPVMLVYPGTGQWRTPLGPPRTALPRYENWSGELF
ncbi:FG-GAP repeat domain-containing protein [Streptomyces sp. NPDC056517]|uniref:FG-GAP repeat domain-containing protein n=1 Tax=Streptomyces sp. NPDC056517 TaxID=3345848 RepID=UPI00369EBB33